MNPMFVRKLALVLALMFLFGFASSTADSAGSDSNCTGSIDAACNVVQGFGGNQVAEKTTGVTISGGGQPDLPNRVIADFGTVGGGMDNQSGREGSVAGGSSNQATGFRTFVGGGSSNSAITAYSSIAGGTNNISSAIDGAIGGGANNTVSGRDTTIAGGSGNIASYTLATVGGGGYNTASSLESTVGGGGYNVASGAYSTIGGGSGNRTTALNTTVAGGSGNMANSEHATIGGGLANRVSDKYGTVSGGTENTAGNGNSDENDTQYATVGGGSHNQAGGAYSIVPGGASNTAGGAYSFAAGRRAKVNAAHDGAFVFADSNDYDFASTLPNQFSVRATGGVRLVTGIDSSGNPTAGVRIAPGGGSWDALSDRNFKANFATVDRQQILTELVSMPITTWNYRTLDATTRHIGPMAQDFAVFGVGDTSGYINTMDANGVALASIQGLYDLIKKQDDTIATLKAENALQQARLDELDKRVGEMERRGQADGPGLPFAATLLTGLGAVTLGIVAVSRGKRGG